MTSTKEHLKNYTDYLRIQNFATSTQKSYELWLRQFLEFRQVQQINEPLDQEQARLFILYKLDQGCAWATINCLYSSLRKYYKEVLGLEWWVKKLPRPRTEKKLPHLISKQEVVRLIEHLPLYKHQVFVTLLYATGIRLHEGLQLKIGDVDGDREQIFIRHGKGAKDRYVHLPKCVHTLLRVYYRRMEPKIYLFNGRLKGEQLSASAVQRAIQQGRKGRQAAITATARKIAVILWNMETKKVPYQPKNAYLFLDQRRKAIVQMRKKIIKFGINPNEIGLFTKPEYRLAYEKRISDNQRFG